MTESNPTPSKRSPSHTAFHVVKRGEKTFWNRLGSAWPHADGKGFNVTLECVPIDGHVSLRIASEDKE